MLALRWVLLIIFIYFEAFSRIFLSLKPINLNYRNKLLKKSVKCIIIIKIKGNEEVKNSGNEIPHRERKTF